MTARTPEQDEARRTAEEETAGSRQVRRRLTFGVAGDLADMPTVRSPWQRAYEAWRAAGLSWGHGAPPRDEGAAEAVPAPDEAAPAGAAASGTAGAEDGAPAKPAAGKAARTGRRAAKKAAAKAAAAQAAAASKEAAASKAAAAAQEAAAKDDVAKDDVAKGAAATGDVVTEGAAGERAEKAKKAAADEPAVEKAESPEIAAGEAAAEEDASQGTAAEEGAATEAASKEGAAEETAPKAGKAAPKAGKAKPKAGKGAGKKAQPDPEDVLVAGPGLRTRESAPRAARRLRTRLAVAAGLVVIAGGVIVTVARGEGADEQSLPGPLAADALFAADPAAETDGLVQNLAAVAAAGGTVVAVGTEGDGVPGRERTRFLSSVDGGRTWSLARVRSGDGSAVPQGDAPRMVAAGKRGWVALGDAHGGGTVAWTSENARTWTRHDVGAVFKPSDDVRAVARTADGFAAVGGADGHAVVWISPDGGRWQRIEGIRGITGFDRVASSGSVLVTHGTYPREVTVKRGRRKITRTVPSHGVWRSEDGGRTWAQVSIPQAKGSYGATKGLTYGPGGFATVREGRHTSGRKGNRRTTRFGVLFTSPDGREWRVASRFRGYGIERFGGTPDGLAVVVHGSDDAYRILRTADGRSWKADGTVPRPVKSSGLTVAAGGAIAISGSRGDDAYLHGVDLRKVPGAVNPERSVRSLAAAPGRVVAAGSSNGAAAIWTAPDGQPWQRAELPSTAGSLSGVVHGGKGWLAVGATPGDAPKPLVMTSQDGSTWEKAEFPGGPPPMAAAAGPSGYVATGTGAVWHSADLKEWKRTDLDGAPAAVTASDGMYVAVGAKGRAPAVWTSQDGVKWTAAELSDGLATGPLTGVAADGATIVAIGADGAPLVSVDAGKTWTVHALGGDLTATAITATPNGFVATASTSHRNAAVLTSGDGVTWRRLRVPGLSGDGERRLTALTAAGSSVLAAGVAADGQGEAALLWKAPLP